MSIFVIAALLAVAPAPEAPAAPAAPSPAKEKKICRSEEVTGSIMPKRVCRTKAEWDAYQAQIGNRVRNQQRTLPTLSGQ